MTGRRFTGSLGLIGIAIATLAVSACTYRFHMKIDGPLESPTVSVRQSQLLGGQVCLNVFSVAPEDQSTSTVWSIESETPDCTPLGELTYGVAPDGFRSVGPVRPLKADVVYAVYISPEAQARQIAQARVVFRAGEWRRLD